MGNCLFTKRGVKTVVKSRKIIPTSKKAESLQNSVSLEMLNLNRNMYYAIKNKRTWFKVLDFLNYRELNQVGQLNK
jgi:uncharacterized FlgJ-related protein